MCVSGGYGMWRRDVVVEVGGFSPNFTCEDIEMTFRVHEHMLRDEAAVPHHLAAEPHRADGRAVEDRVARQPARALAARDAGDDLALPPHVPAAEVPHGRDARRAVLRDLRVPRAAVPGPVDRDARARGRVRHHRLAVVPRLPRHDGVRHGDPDDARRLAARPAATATTACATSSTCSCSDPLDLFLYRPILMWAGMVGTVRVPARTQGMEQVRAQRAARARTAPVPA